MLGESVIRSRHNPIYKQFRSLLRRDRRHQERAILVEGPRFIADAAATGVSPSLVLFSESGAHLRNLSFPGATQRVIDDALFSTLTDTVTSQGVLAIFPFPNPVPDTHRVPLVVIADGLQDPGNLGSLIRSAAGAGATLVVTLPGTVDPWSPKSVRAAAAAQFVIPIVEERPDALRSILTPDCRLIALDAAGETTHDQLDFRGPLAVVIGSEGSGLSSSVRALKPELIAIPLENSLESLNAAVAGSIVVFEAARQRRNAPKPEESPRSG